MTIWTALLGGAAAGSGGSVERYFLFVPGGPPKAGNVYGDWATMMADVSALPLGEQPVVCLVPGVTVVPSAGMPPNGWDMRGGRIVSDYAASGAVVLDCATNIAKFDNLWGIGGSSLDIGAVFMRIAPPPGTSVLNFSAIPVGGAWIFSIGGGSAIDHSTTAGALLRSPGVLGNPTTCVMVCYASQQNTGIAPPLSGPLLELTGDDGAVGVQLFSGNGLPDGWLVGGSPASGLLAIYDYWANQNTLNPAVWVPGFTGGGGFTPITFGKASFIGYTPASLPNWSGIAPTSIADALDRIAAKIGPIP